MADPFLVFGVSEVVNPKTAANDGKEMYACTTSCILNPLLLP
jgi:hypothetical protein